MWQQITSIIGFVGVGLSIVAYLPQIIHLIKERCSAGISQIAYGMWIASSMFVTLHAVATSDFVFILLGGVQTLASTIIFIYGIKYKDQLCETHSSPSKNANTST